VGRVRGEGEKAPDAQAPRALLAGLEQVLAVPRIAVVGAHREARELPRAGAGEGIERGATDYDPVVLEKLGAKGGITPDIALAQRWYEKAKELGSPVAPERIARLAGRSQ